MVVCQAVDLFCGAGGTSDGAKRAIQRLGKIPRITGVNHNPVAVASYRVNHPGMVALEESIENLNPRRMFRDIKVDLLWGSPECTNHSTAKSSNTKSEQSRATAHCITRWADALCPDTILVENVPQFRHWGPLDAKGHVIPSRRGETYRAWIGLLESMGYVVEARVLRACEYGDPTIRERLIIQAQRGGRKIVWPEPTHAAIPTAGQFPWRTVREVINWEHPTHSVFRRPRKGNRPLRPTTMERVKNGLTRYGLQPFMVPQQSWHQNRSLDLPYPTITAHGTGEALAQPYVISIDHVGLANKAICARSLDAPSPTLVTKANLGLVQPYLVHFRGSVKRRPGCLSLDTPAPTLTAQGGHLALCQPVEVDYGEECFRIQLPEGELCLGVNFRMLQVDELQQLMGFSADYRFGGTQEEQVKQIGNAVPCGLAEAVVFAAMNQ